MEIIFPFEVYHYLLIFLLHNMIYSCEYSLCAWENGYSIIGVKFNSYPKSTRFFKITMLIFYILTYFCLLIQYHWGETYQGILQSRWLWAFVFCSTSERFCWFMLCFLELHLYTLFMELPAVLANFLRLTSMMLGFSFLPHSHKLISGKNSWWYQVMV